MERGRNRNTGRGGKEAAILANLVFIIVTGVYLFGVETEAKCEPNDAPGTIYSACQNGDLMQCSSILEYGTVDVSYRFNTILILMFITHIIGLLQNICQFLGMEGIAQILGLNGCLALASFIIMHVWRF